MAEMRDEHFEVISNNRAKEYEKQKKTTNIIKTLLNRYTKKQLIDLSIHLDRLEESYNLILKEYKTRTNG